MRTKKRSSLPAGLEQQHAMQAAFRQACCNDATGRAAADDDVVVGRHRQRATCSRRQAWHGRPASRAGPFWRNLHTTDASADNARQAAPMHQRRSCRSSTSASTMTPASMSLGTTPPNPSTSPRDDSLVERIPSDRRHGDDRAASAASTTADSFESGTEMADGVQAALARHDVEQARQAPLRGARTARRAARHRCGACAADARRSVPRR